MADDKKISELDPAADVVGTERIPCLKDGETVYLTPDQIIAELIADLLGDKYDASNPDNFISLADITDALVTGKALTGLSISGSAVTSIDTILSAIGKLQNQVNAIAGGVNYQGTWNASTNSPAITGGVGTKGHYRVVSTIGTTSIDGVNDWKLGDWIIYNGTAWQKVDNTDAVISVNGYTGIVTLAIADISGLTAALADKADKLVYLTGTTLAFDREAIYGSVDTPETGDVDLDGSDLVVGTVVQLIHNTSAEPEYGDGSGAVFKLVAGTYVNSENNFYVFQAVKSNIIHYWIYQPQP